MNREEGWWTVPVFFLSFIVFFGYALLFTNQGIGYITLWDLFYNSGAAGIVAIIGLSLLAAFFRGFIARTTASAWMMLLFILGVISQSGLGEQIHPIIGEVSGFIMNNIGMPATNAMWVAQYIAMAALVMRVVAFKERLAARGA
jgi:hypothetical protein